MGDDFLRRRNDRFTVQRDICFLRSIEPDLFSGCPPGTVLHVCGTAQALLAKEDELWAPDIGSAGPIRLFRGEIFAALLEAEDAEHVREKWGGCEPLIAQVVDVDEEYGMVTLRVGGSP